MYRHLPLEHEMGHFFSASTEATGGGSKYYSDLLIWLELRITKSASNVLQFRVVHMYKARDFSAI